MKTDGDAVIIFCVACYWSRLRHSSGPQSGRSSWGSSEQPGKSAEAAAAIADDVPSNRHIAKSHDDTTEGAVHCFQDEFGLHISVVLVFIFFVVRIVCVLLTFLLNLFIVMLSYFLYV